MNLELLFKGLADGVRLRIVHLLCQKGELCVCHLTNTLALPQSTISRHLNVLRNCGLVEGRRMGKWVYYSMKNDDGVIALVDLIKSRTLHDPQLQHDLASLDDQQAC
ncbi:MAG: winged helix-turn-helix transcriptional regulator [Zetaproteobacteria bacterium]|nr:winged helix-turn-helix transcriptional regulator [Zetaproteobacteria bacterium]